MNNPKEGWSQELAEVAWLKFRVGEETLQAHSNSGEQVETVGIPGPISDLLSPYCAMLPRIFFLVYLLETLSALVVLVLSL